jgi:hypothetical protein
MARHSIHYFPTECSRKAASSRNNLPNHSNFQHAITRLVSRLELRRAWLPTILQLSTPPVEEGSRDSDDK